VITRKGLDQPIAVLDVQVQRLLEAGEYIPGQLRIVAVAFQLGDDPMLRDVHLLLGDMPLGERQTALQEFPIHLVALAAVAELAEDVEGDCGRACGGMSGRALVRTDP
jgi:hypothetical protein